MNINFRSQRLLPGYDFLQSQSDTTKPIRVLVHDFIQSVVFSPFPQDSELQVERLVLAGNIYYSIGFERKAAFYKRLAALKSVTIQSNWQACYDSLLDSLGGFRLNLDPIQYEKSLADRHSSVWPGLHVQLLEELITCCKKIQTVQAGTLATRHMSFMLHTLDFYLSSNKKRDYAKELEENSTVFGEDSPVPLKLNNGFVIPTVNLTKFPLCTKLEPLPKLMPLRPIRLKQLRHSATTPTLEEKLDNPFIFTPIASHNSLSIFDTRGTTPSTVDTDIIWVQDEPCSTAITLKNTLPFDLKVTSIKLLTDGVPLETEPLYLKLDADPSASVTVNLVGIPRPLPKTTEDSIGLSRLEIFGYSTHLLGVKSNCRLDMIPKAKFPNQYSVEVAPPLPRIEFQFQENLKDILVDPIPADQVDKDYVVMEVKLPIKLKDEIDTKLTILNSSNVDVSYLSIKEKEQRSSVPSAVKVISWTEKQLEDLSTSPLKSGQKLDINLKISAVEEIIKKSPNYSTIVTFEYSGGSALKEMYGRRCAISFLFNITEELDPKNEEQGELDVKSPVET